MKKVNYIVLQNYWEQSMYLCPELITHIITFPDIKMIGIYLMWNQYAQPADTELNRSILASVGWDIK